jgi:hypothetical protein
MEKKHIVGLIFGLILLIIGTVGAYSLDYLNNVYVAYILILMGILAIAEHISKLRK